MNRESIYQQRRRAIRDGEWSEAQERAYQAQRARERAAALPEWVRRAQERTLPGKDMTSG